MPEPRANRDPNSLDPRFRIPFLEWLAEARESVQHVDFIITDTRRTLERQQWLYAQGRQVPYMDRPKVTWTLQSNHRAGIAADIVMRRRSNGELIWTVPSYKWLYQYVPIKDYGLELIKSKSGVVLEWVHLQLVAASFLYANPRNSKLEIT